MHISPSYYILSIVRTPYIWKVKYRMYTCFHGSLYESRSEVAKFEILQWRLKYNLPNQQYYLVFILKIFYFGYNIPNFEIYSEKKLLSFR